MVDDDIITSIQVPSLIKDHVVRGGTLVVDRRGRPEHYSGGFAIVFVFDIKGEKWAFRCWRNLPEKSIEERLRSLSKEINKTRLPYFCEFTYEPVGIIVNGEKCPTTRMRWVEGCKLNEFVFDHRNETKVLKKLASDFLKMCKDLHEVHIAHGDLQHGNILIGDDGRIFLIDYDSMYVPSFEDKEDSIKGLKDYQHPARTRNKYANKKLDYFSELVIYLSIAAIAENGSLAEKYDIMNTDRLLFSYDDFQNIEESKIYSDLMALSVSIRNHLDILKGYLKEENINKFGPFDFMLDLHNNHMAYNERLYCIKCGTRFRVEEDTKYCIYCGSVLINNSSLE